MRITRLRVPRPWFQTICLRAVLSLLLQASNVTTVQCCTPPRFWQWHSNKGDGDSCPSVAPSQPASQQKHQ
uniref:Putative secreted protein n=1 Tax=Ixodes ricinus TaxID=34613 RepID=A0A6B0TS58_IXORI